MKTGETALRIQTVNTVGLNGSEKGDLELDEKVNHPMHYQSEDGLEAIDVIDAFTKNLNGIEAFDIGNAIKYICRFDKKNGVEDLEKAIWYLNDVIKRRKKEN